MFSLQRLCSQQSCSLHLLIKQNTQKWRQYPNSTATLQQKYCNYGTSNNTLTVTPITLVLSVSCWSSNVQQVQHYWRHLLSTFYKSNTTVKWQSGGWCWSHWRVVTMWTKMIILKCIESVQRLVTGFLKMLMLIMTTAFWYAVVCSIKIFFLAQWLRG